MVDSPDSRLPGRRRSSGRPLRAASLKLKDRVLEAASEGIVITDRSLPDNPVIYVNAGFERLTGYSADEVIGFNCRFLQGADTQPEAREILRAAISEDRPCTVEILNYRRDGSPFWNRLSITPVKDDSGRVTHFIGVQSDVTERREAEAALRAVTLELEEANRRLKQGLQAAAEIQSALLPVTLPQPPGIRFSWHFRPSSELAGDTLNILWLDPRRVALYLVDVSGHGVPAALLSVTLSRWLSTIPGQVGLLSADTSSPTGFRVAEPTEVVERLNRQFPFEPRTAQYFTILYGLLDIDRREFRYVSAGHPPLIHIGIEHSPRLIPSSGFPVGLVPNPGYEERVVTISPGERLLLFTDGITEAGEESGEEFGYERLLSAVDSSRTLPLDRQLSELVAYAERWCGGRPFQDDVSLVGIEAAASP
jgi:phosphoserine phosphatase RsbU/P